MNKLNIVSGFVTSIQDIGFLQTAVEEAIAKIISVAANLDTFINSGAVATGLDLEIVGNQIKVYNNNSFNLGYAIDNQSRALKYIPDPTTGQLYTPTNYINGQVHVVAIRLIEQTGTEDILTNEVNIGVSERISLITNIPGQSGGVYPDRIIESNQISSFTLADFTTAQSATSNAWVELGRYVTNGTSITPDSVDLSNVSYLAALIRPNSITDNLLETSLQEAVDELFVQLDNPSQGRLELGSNKFLFLDTTKQMSNVGGTANLVLKDAELMVQDTVAVTAPSGITGTRVIKYNHINDLGLTDQAITPTFGNVTDASNAFTISSITDNFNVDYPYDIRAASFYISTITGGVGADTIDVRIIRVSDSAVMATGSLQKNQITVGQINIFPMTTSSQLLSGTAYKLEIKRSGGILVVQIKGNSLSDFLFRIWFRPPVGKYGSRTSGGSVQLYDQFGALEISNPSRTGLRYIPYAADIPDPNTFVPYVDLDNTVSRIFVAIDVTRGRYFFTSGQEPLGDTFIACNFYIKHKEVNASKIQRNSSESTYFYENVESALDRLSKVAQVFLLVHRVNTPLIRDPSFINQQKYHALSKLLNLTDSQGNFLSLNQGQLPTDQLKVDRFYQDDTGSVSLPAVFAPPVRASGYLHYNANNISDGDQVNINGNIYEFDTNGVTGFGSVIVNILGMTTNDDRMAALAAAITLTDGTVLTPTLDIANSKMKVEYNTFGALGNYAAFVGVVDALAVMTYNAADDVTPNPLFLTDGTMGGYIEFSPRFVTHQGAILKAVSSIYSVGNTYDVKVELWLGTYDSPSGPLAIGLFSGADVISGSTFLVNLPATLTVGSTYHYRVTLINVIGLGSLSIAKQAVAVGNNEDIWYQEIFNDLGSGIGKITVDLDVFDDTGSIFTASALRSPIIDNENFSAIPADPSLTDYQLQSAINEITDPFPSFVPSSLENASVSKFHILVSEWDASDPLQTITVTLHDNSNIIVGTPVTFALTSLQGPGGGFPLQTAVLPATTNGIDTNAPYTIGNSREVVIPYSSPPLDLNKTYHLHITTMGTSANLFIATDGTLPGVNNKLYREFYSPTYIPLTLSLDDSQYGNIVLPSPYYVAVDVTRNRFQFHPSAPLILTNNVELRGSYYLKITFDQLTSESVPRPDGTVVEDSLLFLDKNQHNGVLMMKKTQQGDLIVKNGYVAATLDDTVFAGNIILEPDADLFLFQKRTAPYLYAVIAGFIPGWNEQFTIGAGTLQYPQYKTYTYGNEIVRATFSYNGNGSYSFILYEYSNDLGVTYSPLATKNYVYQAGYLVSAYWS